MNRSDRTVGEIAVTRLPTIGAPPRPLWPVIDLLLASSTLLVPAADIAQTGVCDRNAAAEKHRGISFCECEFLEFRADSKTILK
jgi:hypothetical protein